MVQYSTSCAYKNVDTSLKVPVLFFNTDSTIDCYDSELWVCVHQGFEHGSDLKRQLPCWFNDYHLEFIVAKQFLGSEVLNARQTKSQSFAWASQIFGHDILPVINRVESFKLNRK